MTGVCMCRGEGRESVVPCTYPFEMFICDSSQSQNNCGSRWQDSRGFCREHHMEAGLGDRMRTVTLMSSPPFPHSYTDVWNRE